MMNGECQSLQRRAILVMGSREEERDERERGERGGYTKKYKERLHFLKIRPSKSSILFNFLSPVFCPAHPPPGLNRR